MRVWRPATRDPEHVWLAYVGSQSRIVSDDERHLAQLDLDMLAIPSGLNRQEFEVWVSAQLLASPFTESVVQTEAIEDRVLWTQLAELWDITESEAARSMETVRSWVATFMKRS